jgi:hypothetical protein
MSKALNLILQWMLKIIKKHCADPDLISEQKPDPNPADYKL